MDLDVPSFSDELADFLAAILGEMPFWVFGGCVLAFIACYWLFCSAEPVVSDCASPYVCIEATP